MSNKMGKWFKCVGCGGFIGFLKDGLPPDLPKYTVAHSKPDHLMGVPNSVPCNLYKTMGYHQLWFLHKDKEPIESPSEFEPINN